MGRCIPYTAEEKEAWRVSPRVVTGAHVRVGVSFRSDDQTDTLVPAGTRGTVEMIDTDGHARITFEGLGKKMVYTGRARETYFSQLGTVC